MSDTPIVRRPVRLYLTPEETARLEELAQRLAITKGQTIRAAVERMYREEIGDGGTGGGAAGPRPRSGLDWKV